MCGIAGVIAMNGSAVDRSSLQAMNDRLAHRGPDGEGFVFGHAERGGMTYEFARRADSPHHHPVKVGLAHRRLAILDLSTRGDQPMTDRNARAWIVFNGEIYNHVELRDELQRHGVVFTTRTDTEVLLHAYLHWHEACLEHLHGMFAFALWDAEKKFLFCARDRFGIKPFYYALAANSFVFGSEIKALLACPAVSDAVDRTAVVDFLVHSNCDYGERTMFANVKSLPAGHALTVDPARNHVAVRRYWSLTPDASESGTAEDTVARLRWMLMDVTRKHLISDVRAGSCLSGGLDSSTVVSLVGCIRRDDPAAATAVGEQLETFTSCYDDPQFDEREFALSAAGAAGARSNLVFPSARDFWSDFERMAWQQDMPFGGFSYYAQWRVMRAARQAGVKVLLDGQGGDEVFGGYAKVRYAYFASLLRSGAVRRLAQEMAATFNQGDRYVLDLRNGYRYLPQRLRQLLNVDSALRGVLRGDWGEAVGVESTPATRWWRYAATRRNADSVVSLCQQVQIDDILIDTLPQLLRMEDRSSMAFSIEARVPLLDHRLVEYGLSLPDSLKIRNGWSKFAVREAMRDLMPESVRLRKTKLGFAAPDRAWLRTDLRPQIDELLAGRLRCEAFVDAGALRDWYRSPDAQRANTESYLGLFRILSLEMWMRAFNLSV
jgi:asparagine synthase (glutamine-hydrolysing)